MTMWGLVASIGLLAAAAKGQDRSSPDPPQTTTPVRLVAASDLVMDFTDPIIRGMSLFYCHLLKHEDKGMMAKILFR